jgi:hypothetical protein
MSGTKGRGSELQLADGKATGLARHIAGRDNSYLIATHLLHVWQSGVVQEPKEVGHSSRIVKLGTSRILDSSVRDLGEEVLGYILPPDGR